MKLICEKDALLNAITTVSKAVSNRTTLPILECILLKAKESTLTLTANDLELGIQSAPLSANVEREGILAIESRLFSEIIRKVNGDKVKIESGDNHFITISCGNSEFNIMGQNGEEFPALPEIERNKVAVILQKDLRSMIRQTIFSIAQEEIKPILTGELLEITENKVSLVSVDGYRISYRSTEQATIFHQKKVVIPGKTLNEISKILSQEENTFVTIFISDKHIVFEMDSCMVVSRLLEGEFIKYEQSFTDDFKTKMLLEREAMISCLERASLLARDTKRTPVKLAITGQELAVTSNTEIGAAFEKLEIEMEGTNLEIGFNPKYLMDALKAIEEERVILQFTTPLSPCIIKGLEDKSYKYLVLPLRM